MNDDADIEAFVDALREDGPSDRDLARMQARLAALGVVTGASVVKGAVASSLPAAAAGKTTASATAVTSVATRWASLSLVPKLGVVAAVSATAFAGGVAVYRHTEAPSVAQVVRHDGVAARSAAQVTSRRELEATAPRVTADEAVVAAAPSGAAAPRAATESPRSAAAARTPSKDVVARDVAPADNATARFDESAGGEDAVRSPASTLPEETALIDAAFAALRAGDGATAAALVAEHARRFPNGVLSRERERARARLSSARASAR